jgi:hypothetical protein
MIDYYIEEYGKACAQKQKAKDYLRHYINEAREARLFPTLYCPHKHHWLLNSANDWVEIVLKWDEVVEMKKQHLIDYLAQMEPYQDVA